MFASLTSIVRRGDDEGQGSAAPAFLTRADRGRYRTLDGMESLARPDRSRSRTPLQDSAAWAGPPAYYSDPAASQRYLSPGNGAERSSSREDGRGRYVQERELV